MIRDNTNPFSQGEKLTAQDLNDTFADAKDIIFSNKAGYTPIFAIITPAIISNIRYFIHGYDAKLYRKSDDFSIDDYFTYNHGGNLGFNGAFAIGSNLYSPLITTSYGGIAINKINTTSGDVISVSNVVTPATMGITLSSGAPAQHSCFYDGVNVWMLVGTSADSKTWLLKFTYDGTTLTYISKVQVSGLYSWYTYGSMGGSSTNSSKSSILIFDNLSGSYYEINKTTGVATVASYSSIIKGIIGVIGHLRSNIAYGGVSLYNTTSFIKAKKDLISYFTNV